MFCTYWLDLTLVCLGFWCPEKKVCIAPNAAAGKSRAGRQSPFPFPPKIQAPFARSMYSTPLQHGMVSHDKRRAVGGRGINLFFFSRD